MSDNDILKERIEIHKRRLHKLKLKQATYGIPADPSILIEIEDTEAKLKQLQAELAQFEGTSTIGDQTISPSPSSTSPQVRQIISGNHNAVAGSGGMANVIIYYNQPPPSPDLKLPSERLSHEQEHILALIYRAEQESPDQTLHLTGSEHMKSLGLDPDPATHVERCRLLERRQLIIDETSATNVICRHLRLTDLGWQYCETYGLGVSDSDW
jgi:hypothetical protein